MVAALIGECVGHEVQRFACTRVVRCVDQPGLGHLPVPRRQLASRVKHAKMMISSNAPDSIVVKQSSPRSGVGGGSDELIGAPPLRPMIAFRGRPNLQDDAATHPLVGSRRCPYARVMESGRQSCA